MQRGLGIVASRADALSRFTSAYARLARLPAPTRKTLPFGELMRRVVGLDPRLPVTLDGCFETTLSADADQTRATADQPAQRDRRRARDWRQRRRKLDDAGRHAGRADRGRRTGPTEHEQPVRSVLHDQARRVGYRPRAEPANRRRARRDLALENRTDRRGTRATLRIPLGNPSDFLARSRELRPSRRHRPAANRAARPSSLS